MVHTFNHCIKKQQWEMIIKFENAEEFMEFSICLIEILVFIILSRNYYKRLL